MLSTPSWTSLRFISRAEQQRAHLGDGGADRVALLAEQVPQLDRAVAILPAGVADLLRPARRRCRGSWRSASRPWRGPERSPFTSATKVGTPAADRPSTMPCRVTVLPVPVAPAISPWRLARFSSSCCGLAPPGPAPMKIAASLKRTSSVRGHAWPTSRLSARASAAGDVDSDERLRRGAALDQQQHARRGRPGARRRPRPRPAPGWSPAGC